MSAEPSRVGAPLRALSRRATKAGGYDKVPRQVAAALEGLGKTHLERTWTNATFKLYRLQGEQKSRGGVRPGDFKHKLRTDRHPKTVERHLRELEVLGLLERSGVKGCPRRGPGTRVRYWLPHALNLTPADALPESRPAPRPTPTPVLDRAPDRGPPPDPDGPQSAREVRDLLIEKYR